MSEFTPRLSKPGKGNKYYIRQVSGGYNPSVQGSPVDPDCDVLAGVLESLRRDVDELCGRLSARLDDLDYVMDLATARPPP